MSLDESLHMRLKTLLATLLNGSAHTSEMWSDLSSDMRLKNVHNVSKNVPVILNGIHVNAHFDTFT